MKHFLFSLLFIASTIPTFGQNTFIPDDQFEQALIDLGLDDVIDDWVLTQSIDTVTFLDISWKGIDLLEGIEDFSHLIFLNASFNPMTVLDVSENTSLQYLFCEVNNLTDLLLGDHPHLQTLHARGNHLLQIDLSGLPALSGLSVEDNMISQLDVSQNPLLEYLKVYNTPLSSLNVQFNPLLKTLLCNNTDLTSLDITHNPLLSNFNCSDTYITALDASHNPEMIFFSCSNIFELLNLSVKSGNNAAILSFQATGNQGLYCIEVDSAAYSEAHWTDVDSWSNFEEDCNSPLSLEESTGDQFRFYPNPAAEQIHFPVPAGDIRIRDISGKIIQVIPDYSPELPISEFPQGVYLLSGFTENGETISIRFIKQD